MNAMHKAMMSMLNDLSYKLQEARWIPCRFRHRGGPLNTMLAVPFRKRRLMRLLKPAIAHGPDDITVVIGLQNRKDFRLQRALENLRQQSHPAELIHIVVVDYENPPDIVAWLDAILPAYNARRIPAKAPNGIWNRAHCLNVGIRQAKTKFVLTSDVDVLFEKTYIATAVSQLQRHPLQVIYSQCLDLPPEAVPLLSDLETPLAMDVLKPMARKRDIGWQPFSKGINCGWTALYHHVHGYDEFYEGWGSEDEDLARRFNWLGLDLTSIADTCRYLHQWHPRFEGIADDQLKPLIERNNAYFKASRAMIVNDENWGHPGLSGA